MANTPLGRPEAASLLRGLKVHEVPAEDDGHPLTVYGIDNGSDDGDDTMSSGVGKKKKRKVQPVLLLHGRTWSSVPVYHLLGGGNCDDGDEKRPSLSLMEALAAVRDDNNDEGAGSSNDDDNGKVVIEPYAVDFRGFGGTPRDGAGYVDPDRCAADALSVLNWLTKRYSNTGGGDGENEEDGNRKPALLGWSQGALIAQLVAQRRPETLSKLILYGSIYNPNVVYSRSPGVQTLPNDNDNFTGHEDFPLIGTLASSHHNRHDCAMEDFIPRQSRCGPSGTSISPVPARRFAEAALVSDPIKMQWMNLCQLNECHPSLVKVPTLVIAGDQDPYAPLRIQAELFTNLGRGVDRTWSVVADGDHAVHLMDGRDRFVECVTGFLGKKG